LALKGNQGKLNKQVRDWFKQAVAQNWQGIEYSQDRANASKNGTEPRTL
jgi:hypothetical protein